MSTTAAETPDLADARGDEAGRRARPSAAAAAAAASLPRLRTTGGEAAALPSVDAMTSADRFQNESTSRTRSLSAVQGRGPGCSAAERSEKAAVPPAPRGDESCEREVPVAAREARAEGGALATELLQMKPPPLHGWMGRRAATATWLGLGSGSG